MPSSIPLGQVADLPGFRRQIRITPGDGQSTAAVMDDLHEMVVTLTHDGAMIIEFAAQTLRAPWNVCPGAAGVARRGFVGLPLDKALLPAEKPNHCTHLYDLAVLAAAHARAAAPVVYDLLVSDPITACDGLVLAEIRRDGAAVWQWQLRADALIAPEAIAGRDLRELRAWIATLDRAQAEAARILQWGCIMAGARAVHTVTKDSTSHMALRCYALTGEGATQPAAPTRNRHDFSAMGTLPQARSQAVGSA